MSFHFSKTFENHDARRRAAEVISGKVLNDFDGAVRHDDRSDESGIKSGDVLSIRLAHMGLDIAISAASARPFPGDLEALHFRLPTGGALAAGQAAADGMGEGEADPIMRTLSGALDAVERSEDAFAGVYADALRLASVVRFLSVQSEPATISNPAVEIVEPHPATGCGLPKWRLRRVKAYIDEHLSETVTLAGMADAAGLSPMYFAAQFRVTVGVRPHEYLLRRRIEEAQALLLDTAEPLAQVALSVGFQTQAHFTTVFRRFVGETPFRWRRAHRTGA